MATQADVMAEISQKFTGKWKETKNENLEGFLREMGVNFLMSKMATNVKAESDISVDGDLICVTFKTPVRSDSMQLKLDQEVEVKTAQGPFKVTTTYKDGVLMTEQEPIGGDAKRKHMSSTRQIDAEGQLVITITVGNTVCKRYMSKVNK